MVAKRKISDEVVREIVSARNTPCPCCGLLPSLKSLSVKYGISEPHISHMANGLKRYPS